MSARPNSRRAGWLPALNILVLLIGAVWPGAVGGTPRLTDRAPGSRAAISPRAADLAVIPGAGLVINEILYWPDKRNGGKQFVELYNPAPDPVNLAGWLLSK